MARSQKKGIVGSVFTNIRMYDILKYIKSIKIYIKHVHFHSDGNHNPGCCVSLSLSEGCSDHMMLHPLQWIFFRGFTLRREATDRNIRPPPGGCMPALEFHSAKLASLQFSAIHMKERCVGPFISPARPSSPLLLGGSYRCSVKLAAVLLLGCCFCTASCSVVRVVSGSHPPPHSLECVNLFFFKKPVTSTVLMCEHVCCISSLDI